MKKILDTLYEKKFLRDIDYYFAKSISESFDTPEGELLFALIFNVTESGNTCLDITNSAQFDFYEAFQADIDAALLAVDALIQKGMICEAPARTAPFIKSGKNIYMKSFYTDEKSVATFIKERSFPFDNINMTKLTSLLDAYFPEDNMQKAAALNAALNGFTVISGGPGTGKTSTVFSLLAVLLEMSDAPLKIAVCAPTGKAASRLTETIADKRESYKNKAFAVHIPEKAVTIHRLLGMSGDSRKPTHNEDNKLPYDIVIADEASMVDVRMMAKLTGALSDTCRLILLGDKDQLASVQPGAVLGDICEHAPVDEFTAERSAPLSKASGRDIKIGSSPFANITIMLDKSYRYQNDKGIGLLADASGKGDFDTAFKVLTGDTTGHVDFIEMGDDFEQIAGKFLLDHFRSYSGIESPFEAIETFNKFRILSPHRKQNGGTEHINAIALKTLFKAGLCDNTKRFYNGMPLMIIENDYSQNLFNGETGLIYSDTDQKACFAFDRETVRKITPARLPAHVPAYSMTVHKSQGSEFEHVLFVLPESDSQILTRELFYTAVTRAKSRLTVISTKDAVKACLGRKTIRTSGLFL